MGQFLGGGTAYIEREGGFWSAFFYSDGDTYRYGTDTDYDALVRRMKRQGFTKFVNISDIPKDEMDGTVRNNFLDSFMSEEENDVPKRKIKRRDKK